MARALALVALAWAALALPAHAAAGPALAVSERAIDFGMVAPGERVVREIVVTSVGDSALTLGEMRAFSDAVSAAADTSVLAPGDSTRVRVAFAPADTGHLETKLLIKTNAADAPAFIVIVKAAVAPWYVIDLTGRRLGEVRAGAGAVASIPLTLRADADLRFAGARATIPFVRATSRATADSVHTIVDLSIADRAPAGPFDGFVEIAISGARNDTLRIAVNGTVLGRWRATPNPFHISRTRFSGANPPLLLCERAVDARARVVAVSTTVPGFAARLLPVEEGRAYRVSLAPLEGWKPGTYEGEIRLETDDPKEPLVTVPATVLVGKAGAR